MEQLIRELDCACMRYLDVRIRFYLARQAGESIDEIDHIRTIAHNALISCFNPVLRKSQDPEMAKASVNRVEIGRWGLRRALALLDGSKAAGHL